MVRKKRISSVSDSIFGPSVIGRTKNPLNVRIPKIYQSSQHRRDSRRSFSPTQKKEILYQQDYKCAKCHKKLDPRATHYHHKKPWAFGGRTKVVNGRALCADCHEITSHKDRLKRIDRKRKTKEFNPLF